jgi:hypothetical protein
MGFFDKIKKLEDDESPQDPKEKSPALDPMRAKPPPPPPPPVESGTKDVPTTPPQLSKPAGTTGEGGFGIDDAVQLMRSLPSRNIDLVMQVVKKTLESVRVDVARIIEGAIKKEHVIEERIALLRKEIEQLESRIGAHKKEIAQLESDQKEVSTVKERLILAQKTEAAESAANERPERGERIERGAMSERPKASISSATVTPPPNVAPASDAKSDKPEAKPEAKPSAAPAAAPTPPPPPKS